MSIDGHQKHSKALENTDRISFSTLASTLNISILTSAVHRQRSARTCDENGVFRYSSVLWVERWPGGCPQAVLATLDHGRSPQKETEHEKAQNHRTYFAGRCDSGSRRSDRRRRLPKWWMEGYVRRVAAGKARIVGECAGDLAQIRIPLLATWAFDLEPAQH
jgi:hypothetical protein